MRRLTTILILCFWTFANSFGQTETNFVIADHYKTRKFDTAIFPANYIDMLPTPRFSPTKQEVEKAEKCLKKNLEELNQPLVNQTPKTIIHQKLNKYKRQYFGYVDSNGQRILIINCFWVKRRDDINRDWLKQSIDVLDGGSYYWHVKYNLDTDKLFDLNINGHA